MERIVRREFLAPRMPALGLLVLLKDGDERMAKPLKKEAFLKSDEYKAVAKVLPFCRLWYVLFGGTGV